MYLLHGALGGGGNSVSYFPQLFSFRFIVFWRLRSTFYRLGLYWLIYLLINVLSPWSTVLLEKLTDTQLSRNSPRFMKTKGSLSHSQMPATCHYPKLDRFSPRSPLHPTSWRSVLILSSHVCLAFRSGLFPKVSPPKTCMHLSSPP